MRQSLDDFFSTRDWPSIESATGWLVVRDPDDAARVFLTLTARDGQSFRVLFLCDRYPDLAPSVAFVNADGSKSDPVAWPCGDSIFLEEVKPPPASFLCMPLTREGLAHHPDWATSGTGAWNPDVHSLIDLFNRMQRLLGGDSYQGRGK